METDCLVAGDRLPARWALEQRDLRDCRGLAPTPFFAARSRNWVCRPGYSHPAAQSADPNQRLDRWLLLLAASRPLGTPFAL